MKLPNGNRAVIDPEKLRDYILNPEHPGNGGKAAYFQALGFGKADWAELADALHRIAESEEISHVVASDFGRKYIQDGGLPLPGGGVAGIRLIWIIEPERDFPRLVTAYPRDVEEPNDSGT